MQENTTFEQDKVLVYGYNLNINTEKYVSDDAFEFSWNTNVSF